MRRTLLRTTLAIPIAALALPATAGKTRKTDKRLLGTWRSDKERTTKLWKYKNELDEQKKAKFESIFGKLTRRFTPTTAYSEYEGERTSGKYWVVASDARSVVIASTEEGQIHLQQIFFEEDWIYVVAGYNLEFFRRVEA